MLKIDYLFFIVIVAVWNFFFLTYLTTITLTQLFVNLKINLTIKIHKNKYFANILPIIVIILGITESIDKWN